MSTANSLGLNPVALLPVTGTWAAPFTAYMIFLSIRVSKLRDERKVPIGNRCTGADTKENSDPLYLAIRAHANYAEYVPYAFVLAGLAEANGAKSIALNTILGVFFAARLVHTEIGMLGKDKKSMASGRFAGAFLTLLTLLSLSGYNLYLSKSFWGF
ncbi:MAG: hypothetical protein M1825_005931 [Sarcosagium campestre]|nr:MAG: hypothetical protein M1825_005931 [Sarcosagium campestre]